MFVPFIPFIPIQSSLLNMGAGSVVIPITTAACATITAGKFGATITAGKFGAEVREEC